MRAGRELDALVAEKVMGWKLYKDPVGYPMYKVPGGADCAPSECCPYHYSTSIRYAWHLVGKFEHWRFESNPPEELATDPGLGKFHMDIWTETGCHCKSADSVPLVICLATLAAVEAREA